MEGDKGKPLGLPASGPAVARTTKVSLKKSCQFCVKRKRRCDGFGRKRCSFCIEKDQPECHYSLRQPLPVKPSKKSRRRPRGGANSSSSPPPPAEGQSFWQTEEEKAANDEMRRTFGRTGVRALPLTRGRFSASPATGLIGLQENGFLVDFFGCLGFLSLASESTIRDAMVRIMLASGPRQPESPPPPPVDGSGGGGHHSSFRSEARLVPPGIGGITTSGGGGGGGSSDGWAAEGCWSEAVTAESRSLPRDAATCIMWCAIALGALVRGCPLSIAERYNDLAQESLAAACHEGVTVNLLRAYVTMSFLHSFVGNQRKNYECLKLANDVINVLPPEKLDTGIHELLRCAGKSLVFEGDLASAEEINRYWEDAAPIWKLSDTVMEKDVCSFILSVDVRIDQTIFWEISGAGLFLAEEEEDEEEEPLLPSEIKPAASSTLEGGKEPVEAQGGGGRASGKGKGKSRAGAGAGANYAPSSTVQASDSAMYKEAMPGMLRLEECLQSCEMHLGLGGLLYYTRLAYLQFVNNRLEACVGSCLRSVDCILRYPGMCRYNGCSWCLAFGPGRERYEELRAAYNSARPAGFGPAPPFEEWRGISDVCDHPYCRKVTAQCSRVVDVIG